jgi:hypothetical protein
MIDTYKKYLLMNATKIPLTDHVRALLMQAPSLSAAQLQAATGKSQASISLALQQLGTQVHKLGAARSTRYALTQEILGLSAHHELIWNGPGDMPSRFGSLTYLQNDRLHVKSGQHAWQSQGDLPWFLTPLRPQGFLGRELARARPDFPNDPDDWTFAQVLYMAINHVNDPIGAFFIDSVETSNFSAPNDSAQLTDHYDHLAASIGAGLPAGSSAAGEQPKFTVSRRGGECFIVKFSPPRATPFGERWHQLLHLEKLALQTLQANGIASAQTDTINTARRTYLQSSRFDRGPNHSMRHVVSAAAIHEEFVKLPRMHWVATCETLVKHKLLSESDARTVALSYLFGKFIGNTDMHFGNLSFFVDDVVKPQFVSTPVYDMLPMMWRPDIHSGNLDPSPLSEPVLPAGYAAEAALARTWAIDYWQRASRLDELSAELRALCLENARRLQHGFP